MRNRNKKETHRGHWAQLTHVNARETNKEYKALQKPKVCFCTWSLNGSHAELLSPHWERNNTVSMQRLYLMALENFSLWCHNCWFVRKLTATEKAHLLNFKILRHPSSSFNPSHGHLGKVCYGKLDGEWKKRRWKMDETRMWEMSRSLVFFQLIYIIKS